MIRGDHLNARILYLDDDEDACEAASLLLGSRGYDVTTETHVDAALALAVERDFDVVLTDLRMDVLDGVEVCERIVAAKPALPVLLVTSFESVEVVRAALRAGAYDFIPKPFEAAVLLEAVERAVHTSRLRADASRMRTRTLGGAQPALGSMVGDSPAMRAVHTMIARVAPSAATVLITGESGTGKELIARELHAQSQRADGPFIAVNCAAMPAQLLESELFGHERGAFTDAKTSRSGLFLEAQGGTLFLDEIGEMPPEMQAKLLRALQERKVRPVGASRERAFDARLVAATARDLPRALEEGTFRADLFYRLNVCPILVPPLRDRRGDVAALAQAFTERFAARTGKQVAGLTPEALRKLLAYQWPGNVRELENCIERAVAMTASELLVAADLPEHIFSYRPQLMRTLLPESIESVLPIDEMERVYTAHVLRIVQGNKAHAARLLGFDRRTIYRKLGARKKRGVKSSE
jgi:DNA-binding NtrC family response regulator